MIHGTPGDLAPNNIAQLFVQHTRPGKHTKNYGKSQFLMGKSTISMAIFNSFLYVYQRVSTISEAPGHESVQLVPITPISLWFMVRK